MKAMVLLILVLVTCVPTQGATQAHDTHSPYAGKEVRAIKALSNEEVEGILAGRGMGMAMPAELNQYPGPRHVLDLARELRLSGDQTAKIRTIFENMQSQAVSLGREYIERERELDRMFRQHTITDEALRQATAQIAQLQGSLRNVHLRAHLETTALLSPEQIRQYDVHRGYAGSHTGGHPPH